MVISRNKVGFALAAIKSTLSMSNQYQWGWQKCLIVQFEHQKQTKKLKKKNRCNWQNPENSKKYWLKIPYNLKLHIIPYMLSVIFTINTMSLLLFFYIIVCLMLYRLLLSSGCTAVLIIFHYFARRRETSNFNQNQQNNYKHVIRNCHTALIYTPLHLS